MRFVRKSRTLPRGWALVTACALAASACGGDPGAVTPGDPEAATPGEELGARSTALVQTCTATNVSGNPYRGRLCGGAFIDDCTPGVLYSCSGGARGTRNNCTFLQSCSVGCITGPGDTPITANIGLATPIANDACYAGPPPLTFSTNQTLGGNYVTMTATLPQTHSPYAVVNFQGTTPNVPPLCSPPLLIPPNATQVSWVEPTGVVSATTTVPLWTLISFNDANRAPRAVVSVTNPLTLLAGGTLPRPPLLSFSVTDANGAPISRILGGTNAFARGTLPASTPAPVGGTSVAVTSSPASAFVTDGSFRIDPGCTSNTTWGVLTATSAATSDLPATVTATTGGASLSQSVVVTAPALRIQSVTLTPATVTGGSNVIATIALNRAVAPGDANPTVSLRLSDGLVSGAQLATFPGCTGAPACTGPVQVPAGARSASVTLSTRAVSAQDFITVSASAPWSSDSASANLTINPGGATAPALSSLVLSPASGTCGFSSSGTVSLTAAAPQGGAVVALSSASGSNAQVPASVSVPPGQTQASFTATTGPTCSASSVVITATYGGVSKDAALFFNATPGPTSSATLAVTATGRSGERITSSPAGISVPVGSTGSASFATGTSITLSVSNGRDAIWSGACSSGGNKTRSCTLKLGGNASVTGNVQ